MLCYFSNAPRCQVLVSSTLHRNAIFFLALACTLAPPIQAAAKEACTISADISYVYSVRERSIPLSTYRRDDHPPVFIRAASGAIHCEEKRTASRFHCLVDGKGELFVEGGSAAAHVIVFSTDKPGLAHIYPSGDLSCGLAADFD